MQNTDPVIIKNDPPPGPPVGGGPIGPAGPMEPVGPAKQLSGLVPGNYKFSITTTDESGQQTKHDFDITVKASANPVKYTQETFAVKTQTMDTYSRDTMYRDVLTTNTASR